MVRIIAFLVGIFFAGMALLAFVVNGAAAIKSPAEPTASEEFHLAPKPPWFVTHEKADDVGRRLTRFSLRPGVAAIPGIVSSALRG